MKGIALIEVLFASLLLGITALTFATSFQHTLFFDSKSDQISGGITAIQQQLETLRQQDPYNMPTGNNTVTSSATIGTRTYTVTTIYCPTSTVWCATSRQRHIRVSATYRGKTYGPYDAVFVQLR
jgi:Tfp pilus assembly protein PilV